MIKPLDATGYDTDKSRLFLRNYQKYFERLSGPVNLLELGVFRGGSLLLWRDYFSAGSVIGLDTSPVEVPDPSGRIRVFKGRQEDTALLDRVGKEVGSPGFDVIIDDASHLAGPTRIAFWYLFERYLRPGGIYVIEDWRVAYWGGWPDGAQFGKGWLRRILENVNPYRFKSHDYGLVGLVKQLIDELGTDAYTHPSRGSTKPHRVPRFRSLEVFPGQVFIVKATADDDTLVREPWQRA